MNIENAMEKFFKLMLEGYENTSQGLPMVPKVDVNRAEIFVGEIDDEGWSRWKPMKKDTKEEFEIIEKLLKLTINNDIKEYFNSYWFLQLEGTFKKKDINLEPVIPGKELNNFKDKLQGYIEAHDGDTSYIPIGTEDDSGYLIVIENDTGIIKIENHDTGKFRTIAKSLYELINELKPSIIDFEI